jgi:rhodanese-related sulfurtransferase
MKIEVYNLNKILKVAEREPGCNILSIRDLYSDEPTEAKYACLDRRVARNGINCKVIHFDDIDPYRFYHGMEHPSIKQKFADGQKEPIFFNSQIAGEIMKWVLDIWTADKNCTIKVHCWAGRSRSQAVAYWLNMYFNLLADRNLDDYYDNNIRNVTEKVHFNCEVLRVFTATFG